jgi:N-methylhydantoinase A
LRIGVDVGGTFTDLIVELGGRLHVTKVPTVPGDPASGVLAAVGGAANSLGVSERQLLERTELFVHGSTVATNTVLEGSGARVGLLTTEGFRDSLEIRRGRRQDPWDHRTPFAPVLVPRHLRRPVPGRLDADGAQIAPLDLTALAADLAGFDADGVQAIAICLLNSYADGAHEAACAEAVRARRPDAWVSVSHEIVPILGEYERGATCVMNAYVAPRTVGYLRALDAALRDRGLPRSMLLVQNNGGSISAGQIDARPVTLLLSGPAAGVGALEVVREAIGHDDLISMEIGGTSCDIMLMESGSVPVSDTLEVAGYDVAVPSVDIHTIGAGGGTIARVDEAGLLRVGPRGAGARPGPAAYGLGGEEPTVTDALLVLGRLASGAYAGGSVSLDENLARRAIERAVAAPLGLQVEEAAVGIVRLLEQGLLQAVEQMSFERGLDPRRFSLVAAGGAGPMHGATIGRRLGCREVYVSRLSGAYCALGMLNTDVRHDFLRAHFEPLDGADTAALATIFDTLEARARAQLAADGFAEERMALQRFADVRYIGQQWSLSVDAGRGDSPAAIRSAFEATHERRFRHVQPDGIVELTALRVVARGRIPGVAPRSDAGAGGDARPKAYRRVYMDERCGWVDSAVHDGDALLPGHRITGPAIVEEATTTVCIGPGDRLEVDDQGGLRITFERSPTTA